MSNKTRIYALIYEDFVSPQCLEEGPEDIVFYIGKTRRNPEQREREHINNSQLGQEDKYKFIRDLEEQGKHWFLHVLKEVDENDSHPWEYWYIIEYIRKGSPLKNMKYGDLVNSNNRLRQIASDKSINSIETLKTYVDRGNKGSCLSSSTETQKRAILKSMRFLETVTKTTGTIRRWDVYDFGEGTDKVFAESGMDKNDIAYLHTPDLIKELEDLRIKIEKNHPLPKKKRE